MNISTQLTRLFDQYNELSDTENPQDLIDELAAAIKLHKQHYYQGEPLIDDASYDQLESMLATLSPDHLMLKAVGYNSQGKIAHRFPMLSLQKVREFRSLVTWARQHRKHIHSDAVHGVSTLKLDGISASLVYAQGKLLVAKTRGDGTYGEDITARISSLDTIICDLDDHSANLEIRGELCCSKHNFKALSQEMVRRNLNPPSSERNIVAGILARKDHLDLVNYFSFFAFQLEDFNLIKIKEQLTELIQTDPSQILDHLDQLSPYVTQQQLQTLKNQAHDPQSLESQMQRVCASADETQKLSFIKKLGFHLPPLTDEQPTATHPVLEFPTDEPATCIYQYGVCTHITQKRSLIPLSKIQCVALNIPHTITDSDRPSRCEVMGRIQSSDLQIHTQLTPDNLSIDKLKNLTFQAYDVWGSDDGAVLLNETHKQEFFIKNSFEICEHYQKFSEFIHAAQQYHTKGSYCIDGVVFSLHDTSAHQQIGHTAHHPKYRICYKWQGEEKPTHIQDIVWEVSRTGYVSPIAIIEPVKLSGASIRRVSLHNYRYFRNLSPQSRDMVFVIRSGDVIPKITRIKRYSGTEPNPSWDPPTHCPECQHPLTHDLDSTHPLKAHEVVALLCPNSKLCPPQITGAINHWCEQTKIMNLSSKRIRQLVDQNILTSIADLYTLTAEKLNDQPGMGEKIITKILKSIESSKSVSLVQILCGLGITGMQKTTAQKMASAFRSMDQILKLTADDLDLIDGFAEKSANSMIHELKHLQPLIEKLTTLGVTIT